MTLNSSRLMGVICCLGPVRTSFKIASRSMKTALFMLAQKHKMAQSVLLGPTPTFFRCPEVTTVGPLQQRSPCLKAACTELSCLSVRERFSGSHEHAGVASVLFDEI